mmetsp:Transcript_44602/g.107469  ORF Transcript_44602/g.107469 Transcript_44602/m.107469 type:complete len:81 (+) Transcript_44602:2364-2606(+)
MRSLSAIIMRERTEESNAIHPIMESHCCFLLPIALLLQTKLNENAVRYLERLYSIHPLSFTTTTIVTLLYCCTYHTMYKN